MKPFDNVLVRNAEYVPWIPALFGMEKDGQYITSAGCNKYCIPYEGNEDLLGTYKAKVIIKNERIMAKENRPKEKMRLTIEFADNGIILRNPELEDEVTLALTKVVEYDSHVSRDRYEFVHDDEYRAIGKKVYDWLIEEVVRPSGMWISTGAEIDITATLTGREREC